MNVAGSLVSDEVGVRPPAGRRAWVAAQTAGRRVSTGPALLQGMHD